jgi:UDP-N-acetylmuramate-alanine ligase
LIADEMRRIGHAPRWEGPRSAATPALLKLAEKNDVIITIGAGDVTKTAYELKQELGGT